MKNIVPNYNPNSGNLEIKVELNLLSKYFANFEGLISMNKELANKGFSVKRENSTTAIVSIPIPDSQITPPNDNGVGTVRAEGTGIAEFFETLNSFVNSAIKKELKITEFVPLNGYPVENLQEDIKAAVKAKRNLCIIGEYDEYLEKQKTGDFAYHQYMIDYGTEEYADAAVLISEGNMDELQKLYKPKLTYTEWC